MASYSVFPDRKCLLFHIETTGPWRPYCPWQASPRASPSMASEAHDSPESGIQSLPELCVMCWRFYQNLALPVGGMLGSPSSASLCPWPSMRKYQQSCNLELCDRTGKCKGFDWTEKYTGISFSFPCLFQLAVLFFDCQCCHRIKKVPKATIFLEQLSSENKRTKRRTKSYLSLPRTNSWNKLRVLLRYWTGKTRLLTIVYQPHSGCFQLNYWSMLLNIYFY